MKWKAQPVVHNKQARIVLHFEYDKQANARVRNLPGAQWSNTLKAWHVPDTVAYRKQFGLEEKNPLILLHFPMPIIKNG